MFWTYFLLIIQLAIIEGLLSFDNALALAALVKKNLKDPAEIKKALFYGIWGAYILRIGTLLIATWLMKYEWIKCISGLYLVILAIYELFLKKHEKQCENQIENTSLIKKAGPRIFFYTIVQVELMDLIFSIDSIAVAVAISNEVWVLIAGSIIGIAMMRVAAQYFIALMNKFPVLEKTAFILVGLAGLNILLKLKDLDIGFRTITIDRPIHEVPFFIIMAIVIALSFAYQIWANRKKA